jgi:hypothetical protein
MSIQHKIAGSGEVGAESQSGWALILAVLAIGILVVTSQLTIRGDYIVLVEAPGRVVREFPGRPNLLELEKTAFLARLLQQERALAAASERYSSLGLFYGAENEALGQQSEWLLLQVQ